MSGNFSAWLHERERQQNGGPPSGSGSFWQATTEGFSSLQDGFVQQWQDLQGSLPSDITTKQMRARLKMAVAFFATALAFFALAFFIGLPVLVLRPHKFAVCTSLGTFCMLASGVSIQGFASFRKEVLSNPNKGLAPAAVVACTFVTLYVTMSWRSYIAVLCVLSLQMLGLLAFLMSFVPGGDKGLRLLVKTTVSFAGSSLKWMVYAGTKCIQFIIS